jgi:hypothetical protein
MKHQLLNRPLSVNFPYSNIYFNIIYEEDHTLGQRTGDRRDERKDYGCGEMRLGGKKPAWMEGDIQTSRVLSRVVIVRASFGY